MGAPAAKYPRHRDAAGGAAHAVVYALITREVRRIYVINRTPERAEALKKLFGARVFPVGWDETTGLLGGVVVPLQLIALGCSLGGLRVGSLPRAFALACLRLGMGLGVGFAMAALFGLTGVARAIVILQSAMPVAVSNYLFALIYKRRPEEVAGMVLISTAIAFLGLPVLLAFLLPGTR